MCCILLSCINNLYCFHKKKKERRVIYYLLMLIKLFYIITTDHVVIYPLCLIIFKLLCFLFDWHCWDKQDTPFIFVYSEAPISLFCLNPSFYFKFLLHDLKQSNLLKIRIISLINFCIDDKKAKWPSECTDWLFYSTLIKT